MPDSLLQIVRPIGAIATNTFREAVRNKIFGALLAFAAAVLAFSLVLGAMSLHHEVRVAVDVALYATTLFSMIITVYVSINLLHTEIERRTIYTILSKPVRRWQFVLGKYLGIALLDVAITVLLFGLASGLIVMQGGEITSTLVWAFALILLQLLIVISISLLFASFSTPLLSGLLAGGLFLLGHLHPQLEMVRSYFESALVERLVTVLEYLLPNLASLNLATEIVHDISVPPSYLLHAGWYALSYSAVTLFLAIAIFSQRDLL